MAVVGGGSTIAAFHLQDGRKWSRGVCVSTHKLTTNLLDYFSVANVLLWVSLSRRAHSAQDLLFCCVFQATTREQRGARRIHDDSDTRSVGLQNCFNDSCCYFLRLRYRPHRTLPTSMSVASRSDWHRRKRLASDALRGATSAKCLRCDNRLQQNTASSTQRHWAINRCRPRSVVWGGVRGNRHVG